MTDPIHPASGDLEAVARIIDPEVFADLDAVKKAGGPWFYGYSGQAKLSASIDKARRILALRPAVVGEPAPPPNTHAALEFYADKQRWDDLAASLSTRADTPDTELARDWGQRARDAIAAAPGGEDRS